MEPSELVNIGEPAQKPLPCPDDAASSTSASGVAAVSGSERIGVEEARVLLKRAMDTQGPDFVYRLDGVGCFNVPWDEISPQNQVAACLGPSSAQLTTGCLVGTALRLSGKVPLQLLVERYASGAAVFRAFLTSAACAYFTMAQVVQDVAGNTWGYAYERAEVWYQNWLVDGRVGAEPEDGEVPA